MPESTVYTDDLDVTRDFSGPWLKFSWAKLHFDALKDEITRFFDKKPYTFRIDPHPKPPQFVLRGFFKSPTPDTFGLLIGDIVHNARSALDLLVFQLCNLPLDDPGRIRLMFPITDDSTKFDSQKNRGSLKGLWAEEIAIIESLQPYNRDGIGDPLSILRNINNSDKHRIIQITGAIGEVGAISARPVDTPPPNPDDPPVGRVYVGGRPKVTAIGYEFQRTGRAITEDGAIVAHLTIYDESKVNMHPEISLNILFGEGIRAIENKEVLKSLDSILLDVEKIIGRFDRGSHSPTSTVKG